MYCITADMQNALNHNTNNVIVVVDVFFLLSSHARQKPCTVHRRYYRASEHIYTNGKTRTRLTLNRLGIAYFVYVCVCVCVRARARYTAKTKIIDCTIRYTLLFSYRVVHIVIIIHILTNTYV